MKNLIILIFVVLQILRCQSMYNSQNIDINPVLSWKPSKNAKSYALQVSTNSNFTNLVFNRSGIKDTSQKIYGLSYETKYYWRMNASNDYGTSEWSSVSSFTTIKVIEKFTQKDDLVKEEERVNMIGRVMQSVVQIYSFSNPLLTTVNKSTGTGYVVDDGFIITNHHVIDGATGIIIFGNNGDKPFIGITIWEDSLMDLAVLKTVEPMTLPSLQFAENDEIKIGMNVFVLGYPGFTLFENNIKVSSGIISSNPEFDGIQTDAAVNPGNSGGPCINNSGKIVGTVFGKGKKNEATGYLNEATGYLINNKFAKYALEKAKGKKATDQTTDLLAYSNLCISQYYLWAAQKISKDKPEDSKKFEDKAKEMLLEAIRINEDYAEAHYFLSAFFLVEYLRGCHNNQTNSNSLRNFNIEIKKAIKYDPSLAMNENTIFMKNISRMSCYEFKSFMKNTNDLAEEKENRMKELDDYITKGTTPEILKRTLDKNESVNYYKYEEDDHSSDNKDFTLILSYTSIYSGVSLRNNDFSQNINNFEVNLKLFEKLKVGWGIFLPGGDLKIGYVGVYLSILFGKYTYNLPSEILAIPQWVLGFYFPIANSSSFELAIGQMAVGYNIRYNPGIGFNSIGSYSSEIEKSSYLHILAKAKLINPLWVQIHSILPFSKTAERWLLGFGLSLCF